MMITTEFELMQASADAEQEAQEALEKFLHEWLGKRRKAKPQMPMAQGPGGGGMMAGQDMTMGQSMPGKALMDENANMREMSGY